MHFADGWAVPWAAMAAALISSLYLSFRHWQLGRVPTSGGDTGRYATFFGRLKLPTEMLFPLQIAALTLLLLWPLVSTFPSEGTAPTRDSAPITSDGYRDEHLAAATVRQSQAIDRLAQAQQAVAKASGATPASCPTCCCGDRADGGGGSGEIDRPWLYLLGYVLLWLGLSLFFWSRDPRSWANREPEPEPAPPAEGRPS